MPPRIQLAQQVHGFRGIISLSCSCGRQSISHLKTLKKCDEIFEDWFLCAFVSSWLRPGKASFCSEKVILSAWSDSQLWSNHLRKKKKNPSFILAQKQMSMGTEEEWKAWEGDGIWLSRLGFMPCIPRHLPTHPRTCLHSCYVDVILTQGQILICSIKCIRSELLLPGTSFHFVFELGGSLVICSFPGLSTFDKSWILTWRFG